MRLASSEISKKSMAPHFFIIIFIFVLTVFCMVSF